MVKECLTADALQEADGYLQPVGRSYTLLLWTGEGSRCAGTAWRNAVSASVHAAVPLKVGNAVMRSAGQCRIIDAHVQAVCEMMVTKYLAVNRQIANSRSRQQC